MTFATNVQNLATRIGTEFKAIRTLISGTGTGDVSGLNTTATNLVAAVNEVKVTADGAAGGGVVINDAATNLTEAWSSSKIDTEITGAVSGLATINDAATNLTEAWSGSKIDTEITGAVGALPGINDAATTTTSLWSSDKIDTEITGAVGALPAINDAATTTTSLWSSDKIDTEISTAIADLVDSAPATLDTLNELAGALGDDPNFSATITASLGAKANSADVYTQAQLGDPTTDYVVTFEAALL